MSSINNLEKLIQIATIEQMFELIQKMKNNINVSSSDVEKDNISKNNQELNLLQNRVQDITMLVDKLNVNYEVYHDVIYKLSSKVDTLEKELYELKHDKENNNQYICAQIRGQQLLTSYPGFSKEISDFKSNKLEEENIKLKIEEKTKVCDFEPDKLELQKITEPIINEEEQEQEQEDANELESIGELKKIDQEEKDETEVDEEEKDETEVDEEEVETEVDEEEVEKEEVSDLDEITQEKIEEKIEEDEVPEEEEEEVFEIEIDDVTYFATDEENGILYEVTKDGDVGKKVGIIKDGEPIFN